MADGPIRRKTEKAVRDRAGVPVGLLYDETNDKTIMNRGTDEGAASTNVQSIEDCVEFDTNIQSAVELSVDPTQPIYNYGEILPQILSTLKKIEYHLSLMTDTNINEYDLGD